MSCETDIDLIKEHDKKYPRAVRHHNAFAWRESSKLISGEVWSKRRKAARIKQLKSEFMLGGDLSGTALFKAVIVTLEEMRKDAE